MKLMKIGAGVAAAACLSVLSLTAQAHAATTNTASRVHVSGNHLVRGNGTTITLHGVVRSGMEYMCVQSNQISDGPMDQTQVTAMKAWHVNAVRIPLNEDCWNGNGASRVSESAYRTAVINYVRLLNANGIIAIIDLHWSDGPNGQAVNQQPMPDAANGIPFWTSVAQTFKGNNSVIFDLFNEPYPSSWACWENGGTGCGASYKMAGMQQMINAIRATGAKNVIQLAGMQWASDLSQWLQFEPTDPDHNLIADWHAYADNSCNTLTCWNNEVAPVAAKVPVDSGEFGGPSNARGGSEVPPYVEQVLPWMTQHHLSYTAWGFETDGGPYLLSSYSPVTPNVYGAWYKSYLTAHWG
jgi:endoglucanase